jgi:hypothetical protein
MNGWWSFALVTALALVAAGAVAADETAKIRNPFNVKDVPDPDGDDVQAFAARVKLAGGAEDANAEPWAPQVTPGKAGSLDGKWSSRWNGGSAGKQWTAGAATVKQVGDRVYILYKDRTATYLIDAKRQGESRLVGRYLNLDYDYEFFPWVGEIVDDGRIDGQWTMGRWDLRRKLSDP